MKSKKVLIVEDDSKSRYALQSVLQERGYDVVATVTAEEAAALNGHPYDGAVIDIRLPNKQGTELARDMLARHPQTRIILVTAYNGENHPQPLLPGVVLLVKPIDMDLLCKLLQ